MDTPAFTEANESSPLTSKPRLGVFAAALAAAVAISAVAGALIAFGQAAFALSDAAAMLAAIALACVAAELVWAWRASPARTGAPPVAVQATSAPHPTPAARRPFFPPVDAAPPAPASPAPLDRASRRPEGQGGPGLTLDILRDLTVRSVRSDGPDLSSRQLAVLMTVYLTDETHSVSGLAEALQVHKPVISRALDTLSGLGLVDRRRDEDDRRKVYVERTAKGEAFLADYDRLIGQSASAAPDFTAIEAAVLRGVEAAGTPTSVADIAARLRIDAMEIEAALQALARRGLVSASKAGGDGVAFLVELTPRGGAALVEAESRLAHIARTPLRQGPAPVET
jgi:DNA-binding MarR family transcriptional regulator